VFFDRDGVINIDHGYVYRAEQFDWTPGAAEAILAVKASGRRAFLITNQAGVARGYYDEAAIARLHAYVQATLGEQGAAFDDIRYCPHHPRGVVPAYTGVCACRKPGTGMIDSLTDQWPTDRARSGLIGDKPSDLEAAARAGLRGQLFTGGDLRAAVAALLAELDGTGG
jgi:D-glycero-D-manno-heptose 1,7-bisphosphate phosphatase